MLSDQEFDTNAPSGTLKDTVLEPCTLEEFIKNPCVTIFPAETTSNSRTPSAQPRTQMVTNRTVSPMNQVVQAVIQGLMSNRTSTVPLQPIRIGDRIRSLSESLFLVPFKKNGVEGLLLFKKDYWVVLQCDSWSFAFLYNPTAKYFIGTTTNQYNTFLFEKQAFTTWKEVAEKSSRGLITLSLTSRIIIRA
jgi:hypothetical protein